MIKCKNLSYEFHPKTPYSNKVLDEVNVDIVGNKVLLVGASGSGKTTFFKILIDYIKVNKNQISKPENIVLVMQNVNSQIVTNSIYDEINIGYKQRFFRDISNQEIKKYFEMFGINFALADNPHKLSGGQKKFLMLISSIVMEPEFLILDEPFVGLDYIHRQMLKKFLKETRINFIISTHNPVQVLSLQDQVLVINNKRIFNSSIEEAVELEIIAPIRREYDL